MSASGPEFPAFISLKTKRDAGTEAEFLAAVDSILGNAKRKITDFSRDAQETLDSALSVKRNQAGSLDLGVTEMRAAAEAQNARAVAAREVANALSATIQEEKNYTQEMRNQVAAARLLAETEERESASLRARITVLDQVQERLNKQASATDMVVAAQRRGTDGGGAVTNSVRAQRYAYLQLGQQMQDMVIQTQMGTNAFLVFSQQVPQAAFALSGLGGKIGSVAQFMSGPWGAAIFGVTALLGPMIVKTLAAGSALDEEVDKLRKNAETTEATRKAKELFGKTEEGVRQAILDQKDALDKQDQSLKSEAERSLEAAKANLAHEISIRGVISAMLEQARLNEEAANVGARGATNPDELAAAQGGATYYSDRQKELAKRSEQNAAAIRTAQSNIARAQSYTSIEAGKRDADPLEGVKRLYEGPNGLIEQARKRALAEGKVGVELERQVSAMKKQEQAKLDALSKHGASNLQSGREINAAQAESIASAHNFKVTSGQRTIGEQQWLYDHKRTAENPVALPNANAPHVRGNALDIAFGPGVSPASIRKAYAEEGVRLTKILKESGHFHIEWSTSGADKVNREAEALAKHAQEARDAVAGIAARWDDQPRIVDEVARSVAKLNEIIADPKVPASIKAQAEATKASAQSFIDRGVGKWIEDGNHQLQVQKLVQAGYEDEAAVLDTLYRKKKEGVDLTEEQSKRITDQVLKEQEVNRELERRQHLQSAYLDASRSIRGELESLFAGNGANFGQVFKQLQSKVFVEQVFGKMFEDMDKYIKHNTGLDDATAKLVDGSKTSANALLHLADVVNGVSSRIAGGGTAGGAGSGFNASFDATFSKSAQWDGLFTKLGQSQQWDGLFSKLPGAANDNTAKAIKQSALGLSPVEFFSQMGAGIGKNLIGAMDQLFGTNFFGRMSGAIEGGFQGFAMSGSPIGAALGALAGVPGLGGETGLFGKAFSGFAGGSQIGMLAQLLGGGKGSMDGAQIGGALGSFIPGLGPIGSILGAVVGGGKLSATKVGGSLAGAGIGMAIGGPVGALIGSIFGNLIGGLFGGGPKRGTVSFSNGSSNVTNNKTADTVSNINTVGGSIQDSLTKIASALGTSVGNYGFTLGMRNDVYRVSGSPNADLQDNIGPLLYQGTDQTAALKAALANAIQDGAIAGLSAFEQKILNSGATNIDKAVQDVVDIRGVFKSLKQYTDPVGAALDELDTKFSHLKDVFVTNGASAEDYAKLEKLYGIERAKAIEAANQQVIGSLKNLYDNLTIGDSGLSLRDRQSNAMAKFNPLLSRVQAGDTTAYDAFASAAQTVLDLQRQMGGSQDSYFTLYNQITDLLKTTIDSQTTIATASANRDSPFTSTAANDNQSVIDAIGTSNDYLAAINANLASLIQQGYYGGGGNGGGQNYAVNYF